MSRVIVGKNLYPLCHLSIIMMALSVSLHGVSASSVFVYPLLPSSPTPSTLNPLTPTVFDLLVPTSTDRTLHASSTDNARRALPIAVGGVSGATFINASVAGTPCTSLTPKPSWAPKGSAANLVGAVCEGLPTGSSWDIVSVEVFVRAGDGNVVRVWDSTATRWDNLCLLDTESVSFDSLSSAQLSPEGGTVVTLTGTFPSKNLSNAAVSGSSVEQRCQARWNQLSISPFSSPPSQSVASAVFWVWVGARPCDNAYWVSSSTIKCMAGAGIGENLPVTLVVQGIAYVKSNAVGYDTSGIEMEGVDTVVVQNGGSVIGLDITMQTEGGRVRAKDGAVVSAAIASLGVIGFSVKSVHVGPFSTTPTTPPLVNTPPSQYLRNIPIAPGIGSNHALSMCLRDDHGESSSTFLTATPALQAALPQTTTICSNSTLAATTPISYTRPSISSLSTSLLDRLGGETIQLYGDGFGGVKVFETEGVDVEVEVDGQECLGVVALDDDIVQCVTPSLEDRAGTEIDIVVTAAGQTSDPFAVAVGNISLVSLAPTFVMPAATGTETLDFSATVFGADDVVALFVGGIACPAITRTSDSSIACQDLPVPSEWPTNDAWLETSNGTNVSRRTLLRSASPPEIITATYDVETVATAGGDGVKLIGTGFGYVETDFVAVVIGGNGSEHAMTVYEEGSGGDVATGLEPVVLSREDGTANLTVEDDGTSYVVFLMPPGCGGDLNVVVITSYGLASEPFVVTYGSPSLTSIAIVGDPYTPQPILEPGIEGLELQVCGSGMPPRATDSASFLFAGVSCDMQSVVDPGVCIICTMDTPLANDDASSDWTNVAFVPEVCSNFGLPAVGLAALINAPRVVDLAPNEGLEGDVVTVTGVGMGFSHGYLQGVFVGGSEDDVYNIVNGVNESASSATLSDAVLVTKYTYISEVAISFVVPVGAGSNVPIRIATSNNLVSSGVNFKYEAPEVTSITPNKFLPGPQTLDVTACGDDFPQSTSQIELFGIGGIDCNSSSLSIPSANCLKCTGLTVTDTWTSNTVVIVVSGGQKVTSNLATFYPSPLINQVLPGSNVQPGTVLSVRGQYFGVASGDVNVYIGGTACGPVTWVSSTEVECTVSASHPVWSDTTEDDYTPKIGVSIKLRTSLESAEVPITPGGVQLRPPPFQLPRGVVSWRPVGQWGTVVVRWRFPGSDLESSKNPLLSTSEYSYVSTIEAGLATGFFIEASTSSSFPSDSSYTSTTVTRSSNLVRSATSSDASSSSAWEWHEAELLAKSRGPLYVRIRAKNSDGNTDWVLAVDPESRETARLPGNDSRIPESCESSEYLQTSASSPKCAPCPTGGVCGGLAEEGVTAQDGYWRVPWTKDGVGFVACTEAIHCTGYPKSPSSSAFTKNATDNTSVVMEWLITDEEDRPAAVTGFTISPSSHEGCAPGRAGVMCEQCAINYYPSAGACVPCGPRDLVITRFFFLALFVAVVLSVLLIRAWRSRLSSSSREVIISKIILTHLQTVTVVGAVQLQWPKTASGFFTATDTTSSFSTSGLAVECLLGQDALNPITRTLVFILGPLFVFIFAGILWYAVSWFETCCPCLRFILLPPKRDRIARREEKDRTEQEDGLVGEGYAGKRRSSSGSGSGEGDGGGEGEEEGVEEDENPSGVGDLEKAMRVGYTNPMREKKEGSGKKMISIVEERLSGWALWRERMFLSVVMGLFLIHTPVSRAAFAILTCRTIAPTDEPANAQMRMLLNLDWSCDDPVNQATTTMIAVPTIILISLGVPVGMWLLMRFLGRHNLEHTVWRERLGVLHLGFKRQFQYWECVVLLRKVAITFVTTTLAPSGAGIQLSMALFVLLIAMAFHSRFEPYRESDINFLEDLALITSASTLIAGQVILVQSTSYGVSATSSTISQAASVLIVVFNVAFLCAALYFLSSRVRLFCKEAFKRRKVSSGPPTAT